MSRMVNIALLGALSCSPGAPRLASDLGSVVQSDAGTSPDASTIAPDGGVAVDGPPRDIEITAWFIPQAGDDAGTPVVIGFQTLAGVRAQWRWRDGGWGSSQGTFEDDGGYRIRDVPAGEAIVFFPTIGALVTTESQLDFSLVVQGRLNVRSATPSISTTLLAEVSNLSPWIPGDSLTAFGRETPFVRSHQPMLPAGTPGVNSTYSWNSPSNPLPLGSLGDTFGLFQLRERTGGPLPYRSIVAGGTVAAPELTDGANATVRISLASPATGSRHDDQVNLAQSGV